MFTARHLALGSLAALLAAGEPVGWILAVTTVAALAVATTAADGPDSLFAFPRWVFRALSLPTCEAAGVPKLAIAWWRHGQG